MIYSILFVILAALFYWYWRVRFIPAEVARNLAAFQANGSADDLQRGYHSRESWRRVWVGVACCGVPSLSFAFSNLTSCLLSFLAVAALLAGTFARYFTPWLNLARVKAGETWLSEWTASPASKSWPDAAAWAEVRKLHFDTFPEQSAAASRQMETTVLATYRWCCVAALVLAGVAVWRGLK